MHNATLAQIGRQNMDRHQALDNEADLAAARQEWQAALAEARGKREAAEADGGPDLVHPTTCSPAPATLWPASAKARNANTRYRAAGAGTYGLWDPVDEVLLIAYDETEETRTDCST